MFQAIASNCLLLPRRNQADDFVVEGAARERRIDAMTRSLQTAREGPEESYGEISRNPRAPSTVRDSIVDHPIQRDRSAPVCQPEPIFLITQPLRANRDHQHGGRPLSRFDADRAVGQTPRKATSSR